MGILNPSCRERRAGGKRRWAFGDRSRAVGQSRKGGCDLQTPLVHKEKGPARDLFSGLQCVSGGVHGPDVERSPDRIALDLLSAGGLTSPLQTCGQEHRRRRAVGFGPARDKTFNSRRKGLCNQPVLVSGRRCRHTLHWPQQQFRKLFVRQLLGTVLVARQSDQLFL